MHNLVVMLTFSVFEQKYPFGANLVQKNNFQFKLKFGTQINSNMHNSMVVFTFSVLEWEYHFWENLVQKVKIVSLSWNLLLILIQICIEFNSEFTFSVFNQKYFFWTNLVQKNQNCQFKLKFGTYTNSNMHNSMLVLTFSVLDLFLQVLFKKSVGILILPD